MTITIDQLGTSRRPIAIVTKRRQVDSFTAVSQNVGLNGELVVQPRVGPELVTRPEATVLFVTGADNGSADPR
jgi:hypothetical protein